MLVAEIPSSTHMVNEASGFGTGQLPDKEGQMYHVGADDLCLVHMHAKFR